MTSINHVTKVTRKAVVEHYLDEVAGRLFAGERVVLKGICTLQLVPTLPRTFKNPRTGAPINKAASLRLQCRTARRFKHL